MSNIVKYFHSNMLGAPVLNYAAGTLIAVLDACLVNGWGSQVATSVVITGGVAKATLPSGHPFEVDTVVMVSGATPSALNGEFKVSAIGANTVSFATALPDQTATGTITVKLAPLGWAKPFSGTNLAAYRANDIPGVRAYLRVDDTNMNEARVVGYESMSDISSGVGAFPHTSQQAGGGYWPKANSISATRAWTVIGDGKTFYLHMHCASTVQGAAGAVWGFGDFIPTRSGDAYCAALCSGISSGVYNQGTAQVSQAIETSAYGTTGGYMPRAYSSLGGSTACIQIAESFGIGSSYVSGYSTPLSYPNGPDNSLILSRKILLENGNLRGTMPGVLLATQACHSAFNWLDKIPGQGLYAGRKLLAVKCGGPAATTSSGVLFFDITGPWG